MNLARFAILKSHIRKHFGCLYTVTILISLNKNNVINKHSYFPASKVVNILWSIELPLCSKQKIHVYDDV